MATIRHVLGKACLSFGKIIGCRIFLCIYSDINLDLIGICVSVCVYDRSDRIFIDKRVGLIQKFIRTIINISSVILELIKDINTHGFTLQLINICINFGFSVYHSGDVISKIGILKAVIIDKLPILRKIKRKIICGLLHI